MPSDELWEVAPRFAGWPSVKVLPAGEEPELRAALQQARFDVRTLEGRDVTGDESLFEAVARALELPEDFGANWDAFADSLFDLTTDAPGRRLALVWREAHLSLAGSVATVMNALLLLHEQASHAEPATGAELYVYLLGDGPGWA